MEAAIAAFAPVAPQEADSHLRGPSIGAMVAAGKAKFLSAPVGKDEIRTESAV